MKRRYRITPEGHRQPTDSEIARYRDPKRLLYNYSRAVQRPQKPLYRDPKAFLILLLIVLLAYLISEERRKPEVPVPAPTEQAPPVPSDG
ncbi:MAG: hypothetical protein KDB95_10000 [Flavobacteriales bacterium]|nr:hypothetical protein [Flavobacteriales bacterium]